MAFAQVERSAVSEINITPLVDVLLVLLVIFMLAAPVVTRELQLNLAPAPPTPITLMPEVVSLRIAADGLRLDGRSVNVRALEQWMTLEAGRETPAILSIDADDEIAYARLTEVLAAAQNAGFARIAFEE